MGAKIPRREKNQPGSSWGGGGVGDGFVLAAPHLSGSQQTRPQANDKLRFDYLTVEGSELTSCRPSGAASLLTDWRARQTERAKDPAARFKAAHQPIAALLRLRKVRASC